MADRFELDHAVVVFDQVVYAKAQIVRFLNHIIQTRLVPRLGEFHTVMTFLGVLGKRFGDAGMKDILIESQCIAAGSMKGVISGHSYNRSIRAHKLLAESLYDLVLEEFVGSLETSSSVEEASLGLARLTVVDNRNDSQFSDQVLQPHGDIYQTFLEFIESHQINPVFSFWWGYIDMVTELLAFIRATRESDWDLHLRSLRHLLPWFFTYDHQNYACYGTLYYMEMSQLENSHPDIFQAYSKVRGSFTYQSGHHRLFTSVACDQAIEQTVNRHTKSQGGIVGFTLKPSASQRWTASHPQRTAIHERLCQITSIDSQLYDRHGLSAKSWEADEEIRT